MQGFFLFNHNPKNKYKLIHGNSTKKKKKASIHENKHRELLNQSLYKSLTIQVHTTKTLKSHLISRLPENSKDEQKHRITRHHSSVMSPSKYPQWNVTERFLVFFK